MSQKTPNRLSTKQQFREKNESPLVQGLLLRDWPGRLVPLDSIAIQKQIRTEFKEIESLAENIRTHGLIHPITVLDTGAEKNRYQLITGERRFHAYKLLKQSAIPARVLPQNTSSKEVLGIQLSENIQKSEMHLMEVAEGITRMIQDAGFTQAEIASILNKPQERVSEYVRVAKLPEKIKTILRKAPTLYLHQILRIARMANPAEQLKAAERFIASSPTEKKKIQEATALPHKFKSLKKGGYQLLSWKATSIEEAIHGVENLLKQLKQERTQQKSAKKH